MPFALTDTRPMLRINSCKVTAKTYFTQDISRDDSYYANHQELPGMWGGIGAARLGLVGRVSPKDFAALCDNIHPHTGERLTVRTKAGRRMGYDLTFDAPKSVSLLNAFSNDKRIIEAYNNALNATLAEIEANAQTRLRQQGKDESRTTGNLVFAKFTHLTARPFGGVPDPQLHTHVFVLNATYDSEEDRWKAVQMGQIKSDAPYYQAIFHSKLASNLQELGYTIRPTKHAFEIEGISEPIIVEFSKRKGQIEKHAQDKGITHPKIKSRLGALTREAKRDDLSPEKLNELWQLRLSQFSPEEQKPLLQSQPLVSKKQFPAKPDDYRKAILQAQEHCFYHNSVVDEKEFLATALRFSVGRTDFEQLRQRVAKEKSLIRRQISGSTMLTTPEILAQEKQLTQWVKAGKNTCEPFKQGYICTKTLDDEQKQALKHVLESTDRATGVHGKAGTGKTTLMRETVSVIRTTGIHVAVLAPTADASRKTLRESGFEKAETVEKFMVDSSMQQEAQGGVIWIDEAGLISVPDMKRIIDLAERLNTRLLFTGDTRQHSSVERGDALRLLQKHAGLSLAELTIIRRQKPQIYRDAINDLSEGKIWDGFRKLDQLGAIVEIPQENRHDFLASQYIESIKSARSALVVSPTHAEGRKVTHIIREKLKTEKKICKEQSFPVLQKIEMTLAEKKNLWSYRSGWVVQMIKSAPNCRSGERLSIANIDEQGLFVRHSDGRLHYLDHENYAERFEVFEHANLNIGIGDHIRITRNGKTADGKQKIDSGTIAQVSGFTPQGDLEINSGPTIPRHYGHIAYGYVVTSYVAQGKTVQDVYIAESSESFPAAGREQFYVSTSRGTDKIALVTNDKAALFEAVERSRQRLSALDMTFKDLSQSLPVDHVAELIRAQKRAIRHSQPLKPQSKRMKTPAQTRFASLGMDDLEPELEPQEGEHHNPHL